mmetsp:Transcript_14270/g.20937  ORF Transcript_14270/g.20937 Transcript_14270/m.20937 type:complete len:82 (-) Transcript_14270:2002-2247(-)
MLKEKDRFSRGKRIFTSNSLAALELADTKLDKIHELIDGSIDSQSYMPSESSLLGNLYYQVASIDMITSRHNHFLHNTLHR